MVPIMDIRRNHHKSLIPQVVLGYTQMATGKKAVRENLSFFYN
jgi:hypothetical protein